MLLKKIVKAHYKKTESGPGVLTLFFGMAAFGCNSYADIVM